ncbi:MAG: HD domain-containing protein, partial [Chloroflexia bacterium]|nr:HD domain-containing protein [Chloroflexia bacterium]
MVSQSTPADHNAPTPPLSLLAALPPEHAGVIARLAGAFTAGGAELYLVGGIVRDLLLQRPLPDDLDFTTSAPPERIKEIATATAPESAYLVGERFGTVGLVYRPGPELDATPLLVEITTYRAEHYPDDSRHPEVVFGQTLTGDLRRRDFTINAIALEAASGELIDPFDGQADLAQAVLRAVGDPDQRFAEDPLRLLRAARFVAELGFRVDAGTATAMTRQAQSLARISRERILAELTKLLVGPYAAHGLEVLRATSLLRVAMLELGPLDDEDREGQGLHREKDLWEHTKRVVDQAPRRPIVRWAALLHDAAKPLTRSVDASGEVHFYGHERVGADLARRLMRRLNADRTTSAAVSRLVELHLRPASYEPDWTDSAVRRLALEAGDVLDDLLDLAAADVTSARETKRRAAATRVAGLRAHLARLEAEHALAQLQSPLDGDELMALFARSPGRWIATIKNH